MASTSALQKSLLNMFSPLLSSMAKSYKGVVGARLTKLGLRYDDLIDPDMDMDAREALRRLGPEVEIQRNQRLKRALDLSMKHVDLDPKIQKVQTPFNNYLHGMLEQVKMENAERQEVGTPTPYNRQLP
jgi:ubiquinol-cytochrome c reductase subunit 7